MPVTETRWPMGARGDEFRAYIEQRAPSLAEDAVEAVAAEVPELVGPDPRLRQLLTSVIKANVDNFAAAVAYKVPPETPFEPPAAVEHARLLAQRGVRADAMLLGYQVTQRSLTGPVIEAVEIFVEDRDQLVWNIEAVLAYLLTQGNASSQAALRTHADARDLWLRSQGVGLAARVDAVLSRVVTDARTAEVSLNYPVSGKHVALVIRLGAEPDQAPDLAEVDLRLRALSGVRDTLLVPRDERTLYCWLHTTDDSRMDEWLRVGRESPAARVAVGELGEGIEGFRLSHAQALAAGAVLAEGDRGGEQRVVRYRDVAAVSFMVAQPAESRAWVEAVLGALAGPDEEREPLRETLQAFLQEGENAVAAGRRLFVHRNTVRYRIDRAREMLPRPLEEYRLDVALALEYCAWVRLVSDRERTSLR